MKLIAIKPDGFISVNDEGFFGVNLDGAWPKGVRAIDYSSEFGGHYEMEDGGVNVAIPSGNDSEFKALISIYDRARADFYAYQKDPLYKLGTENARKRAYGVKLGEINSKATELQEKNFFYEGHWYFGGKNEIITIQGVFIASLGLSDSDPIPTPEPVAGKWLSADVDETGKRVAVDFTVGDFKKLLTALYGRDADIWSKKQAHLKSLSELYESKVTGYKILAYDVSKGW